MELKIEITSKETIKPSSSTPDHLRIHNLNVLDQFVLCARNMHVPIILFYDTTKPQNQTETSFLLKNSLQETLTHFYPLAGRVKGHSYIDCNDAGATYIETSVAENMKEVLRQPKLEKLRQLLPVNPYECIHEFSVPELLLIQVNHFSCGGVVIGVCASHTIADAATLGTFVRTWVAIARGNVYDVNGIVTDTTSIFPPVDDSETVYFSSVNERFVEDSLLGIATNSFVFDGAKIAALKKKVGRLSMSGNSDLPTRFEALSALILGVLMSITDEKRNDYVAMVMLNLRKRMNPPLPPQCIGNVFQGTQVMSLSNESGIDFNDLAQKIRESVRNTNDENVRMFYAAGGMLNYAKLACSIKEKMKENESIPKTIVAFSSWCNSPFYEADFGWGKPTWVATALNQNRIALFLDGRDGVGIEVWLGLQPEVMSKFEQNPDIIEFASFVPTK